MTAVDSDLQGGGHLAKGLAVLQLAAQRGPITVADVAQGAGLSRSSAYRMVERLCSSGYLQTAPTPGGFRLGPSAVPIGLAALNQMEIMDVAPARLAQLAVEASETVNLAVLQGEEMVYVYQAEGPGAVKVTARLGTRRPLGCSSLGKAYLAALPTEERAERLRTLPLVPLTRRSLVTRDQLAVEVEETAARGYAIDEEEVEDGVACVGAALRDFSRRPVAAISIAGPAERMPGKRAEVVDRLLSAADEISARLGYVR